MAEDRTRTIERFVEDFARFETSLNGLATHPMHAVRQKALQRIQQFGFPTLKHEEWKYTNLNPILRTAFRRLSASEVRFPDESILDRFPFLSQARQRLVFVDGHYSKALSSLNASDGVLLLPLQDALASHETVIAPYLGQICFDERNSFAALNSAFLHDAAVAIIPKGLIVEPTLFVLHLSSGETEPTIAHPHTLILAGEHSSVSVVEIYGGFGNGSYFTNAVTEIVAGMESNVDHYRIQRESAYGFHVSNTFLLQARGSVCSTFCMNTGGALVRNDVHVVLSEEGSEATLNGLTLTAESQHVDNHTVIDHAKPHCSSHELYKGILDGSSRNVFSGKIIVRKDAQKTDAKQTNNNLILSDSAMVDTKPQLEIFADDVKCTHGATIGRLDEDALFYLRSRGIDKQTARSILTYAFASDMIHRVKVDALRDYLDSTLHERLRVPEDQEI